MQGVHEEVRKVNKLDNKKPDGKSGQTLGPNTTGVVIVTGVAKKKVDKKKGELIEQNQDGLEVILPTFIHFTFFCVFSPGTNFVDLLPVYSINWTYLWYNF